MAMSKAILNYASKHILYESLANVPYARHDPDTIGRLRLPQHKTTITLLGVYQVGAAVSSRINTFSHYVRDDHRLRFLSSAPAPVLNRNTCCESASVLAAHRHICVLHNRKAVTFRYFSLLLFKYWTAHQNCWKTTVLIHDNFWPYGIFH